MKMSFTYNMVNDVKATKEFYGDILGMKVEQYAENKYIGFKVSEVNLLFFKADRQIPIQTEWAWQPGDATGSEAEIDSFSIEYDETLFREAYKRLKEVPQLLKKAKPEWRQKSYWGLTVKDPSGKTIELYTTPNSKPKDTNPVWQD